MVAAFWASARQPLCAVQILGPPTLQEASHSTGLASKEGKSMKMFRLKNQKDHDLYLGYSMLYAMISSRHRAKNVGHLSTYVVLIKDGERTWSRIDKPLKRLSQNLLMPVDGANLH